MKVAFVGDSYCADVNNGSWLGLVVKEYNAEIICKGRGGTAQFHAYEDLLEIIDEADYIIFCITTYSRLPNRFGIPIDTNWLEMNAWDMKKLIANVPQDLTYHNNREQTDWHHYKAVKAAELYYKDLMSLEFHQVAQKGILMQMDELLIEKKKKCIWFPCFEDGLSMQSYIPKSGPIASHYLNLISRAEYEGDPKEVERFTKLTISGQDGRLNHFNTENNRNMARLIIDTIENDNFNPKEIKMEDYFKVSI
jgi:hypothetical protein